MTNALPVNHVQESRSVLSARLALRLAWVCWVVLLVIPFLTFLYIVFSLSGAPAARSFIQTDHWFLAASIYLLMAGPLSFFWRGHVWQAYWAGKPVTPGKYLFGMMSIWLALEFGGLLSLVGCIVDHSLLPNLLPALVAFMFFVTLWPSGRAMFKTCGNENDPQVYEEPR